MAQPTKKMIVFIDTDRTFFIQYTSLSNSNINVSTQKARRNLTKITARLLSGGFNSDIWESHLSFRLASDDSRIGITTTVENNSKNLAHESSLPRYTNRTMSNKRSSITVVTSRNRILLILILSGFIKLSRLDTTFIQATLKRYNTEYHFCLQYSFTLKKEILTYCLHVPTNPNLLSSSSFSILSNTSIMHLLFSIFRVCTMSTLR